MSHKSRLCAILIDTESDRFDTTVRFWSAALGRSVKADSDPRYSALPPTQPSDLDMILQRVEPGQRGVHLDIETDDVEAEVRRLEALGARRKRQVKAWWVMEDPDGHAFCVVPVSSAAWPEGAAEWA